MNSLMSDVQPVAARVSRTIADTFTGYIEQGDLCQEMLLWALAHEDKVSEWLTATDEDESCTVGRRKLHTTFRRLGRSMAHTAKAERLGYSTDDLHFYSAASIEELLPRALDYDEWLPSKPNDGSPKSKQDPALGNDLIALLCDVKWAYQQGSEDDRCLLYDLVVLGEDPGVVATDGDVTTRTIERRLQRALGRMSDRLGGSRPPFGRHAMSNAAAQHITRAQTEV